jgi:hypothetical protein
MSSTNRSDRASLPKSRRPIRKRHFSAVRKNPRLVARINAGYLPGGVNRHKVRH